MCAIGTWTPARLALTALLGVVGLPDDALAQAAPRSVVLASNDAALAVALRSALAPWDLSVVVVEDEEPGATMPVSAERGRELSERHDAIAAAWISVLADGAAVWVYDRASDRVNARRLASVPPYDEVTAAAVALSIKTLLLHTAAAPPAEVATEDRAAGAGEAGAALPPDAETPLLLAPARLELSGGIRAAATTPPDVEARLGLGALFWPIDGPLVLGVRLRSGTGVAVDGTGYSGRWLTFDLHAVAGAAFAVGAAIDVGVGVELGATVGLLDGSLTGARNGLVDGDPTGRLYAEIGALLAPFLHLALRVAAFVTPRSRSFVVGSALVFEVGHAALDVDLVLEVPLAPGSIERR